MGCEEDKCCEGSCDCSEEESCSTGNEMVDGLMKLGDKAWEKLMKEKIMRHYEKAMGPHMDKVAQATAEACIAYWTNKMGNDAKMQEHVEKIQKAMNS